jgi:hypothetical protein
MGPYGAIWAYVHGGSNVVDIGADLKVPGRSAEVWEFGLGPSKIWGWFIASIEMVILEVVVQQNPPNGKNYLK